MRCSGGGGRVKNRQQIPRIVDSAYDQQRPEKTLISQLADLEVLHKQEVKAKEELQTACWSAEGIPQHTNTEPLGKGSKK